ncbi:MAG: molybdopterin molybdotransferase MoeA [Candidatus Bathyarchaeota archaeon]|nr:MAG: molybdopterin molybdotransferase MoeA [Candidatus Bathyarchaeota archaeon]
MVRLKGFKKLTLIDTALERFWKKLRPTRLEPHLIPLDRALDRVTAALIIAESDLPSFDRSTMDGYAIKAKDTFGASKFKPKCFQLVYNEKIQHGETIEIWTGNPLPKGADTVVRLENTKKEEDKVDVLVALAPGTNVSKKGEDAKKGHCVIEAGIRLNPYHLGLLAALGVRKVTVVKKPKVALLATGNELVEFGKMLKQNQVVEVNSIILSGLCSQLGAEAITLGIAQDDANEIEKRIKRGLAEADIVITTGGTSVGAHDLVPKVIERMESHSIVAHGIALRPGMPTALAVVQGKPVIILSGNPVAAAIGFEVFVRPLIHKLMGTHYESRVKIQAKLTRKIAGVLGRRVFLRVEVFEKDGEFFAEPIRIKGSSIISTMTRANGYIIIPENREGLKEHELVTVILFDTLGGMKSV